MSSNPLSGHSGFTLRDGAPGTIVKTAPPALAPRLVAQCAKQKAFVVQHAMFKVCEVLEERDVTPAGEFAFVMRRYPYLSPVDFTDRAPAARLTTTLHALLELVEEFLGRSPNASVPRAQVVAKSEAVIARIAATPWAGPLAPAVARHRQALDALPATLDLPVGCCHGDLTFANILFRPASGPHVLIDFLDDYLNSPLLDIAKLRQETLLGWSSMVTQTPHDRAKYLVLMQRFDEEIRGTLIRGRHWEAVLPALTGQTLLRVAPYVRDARVMHALVAALAELEQEPHT